MQPVKHGESSESMPKVDFKSDLNKIRDTDLIFMKKAEQENFERAIKLKRWRKTNNIFGSSLIIGALGVYFYTMYAVKQENFLDDFEEPEKIIEKSSLDRNTL